MKSFIFTLALLSSWVNLYGAPAIGNAVLSVNPVTATTGIYFESATLSIPSMTAGTTPAAFLIDLYSTVDTNKLLELLLQTTPVLSDGFGNTIPLTYSYTSIANGTTTSVLDNTWIEIIKQGTPSFRDGVTSPGYLTIASAALGLTQAAGSYSTGPIAVDVMLDGNPSTAIGYLTLNAVVEEFIVIGFVDTSADITGVRFIGDDIDFGLMAPSTTPTAVTRDVFVHTNRSSDIQITFANTPSLVSAVDGLSTIPVTYSYSLNAVTSDVVAGVPFIASSGSNDGTVSVGSITFTPDALPATQVSGTYDATVNVVVSAM